MVGVKNKIDYIFIYLLISISGNMVFENELFLIAIFLISSFLFLYRKKKIDKNFLYFILVLTIILHLQVLKFNFYSFRNIIGVYIRIFLVYFIIKSIGISFIEKYVNTMVLISIISLVIYALVNFIPGFSDFLINNFTIVEGKHSEYSARRYFLGLYTIIRPLLADNYLFRNHGPFWEAGAMAGYTLIAIIFNTIRTNKIFNKIGVLLIITVLTTLSTTAYIALFFFTLFFFLSKDRYKNVKWIIIPIAIIVGFISFNKIDFLGNKIENKLELTQRITEINSEKSSRFLDAIRDLRDFDGHEIIGRGGAHETRFSEIYKKHNLPSRTHGVTDHLVRYGSIFFILTFLLLYKSQLALVRYYGNINKIFAVYTTVIIFIMLQSELYFNYPLFWGLLFIQSIVNKNKKYALRYNTSFQ